MQFTDVMLWHSDPFTFMRTNNKIYGFVITMYEFEATIKTLWSRTKEFVRRYPQYLHENNSLDFLVDGAKASKKDDKEIDGNYNLCHFWSNFEIASLNFIGLRRTLNISSSLIAPVGSSTRDGAMRQFIR